MADTKTSVITLTPTITAGVYGAADAVGGLLTFTSRMFTPNKTGVILSVSIVDAASQDAELELVLFDRSFTVTADNAPFAPSDADLANCLGVISIAAGSYYTFSTNSVATVRNVGLGVKSAGTTHGDLAIYGQLVTRGTPTYAATSDIDVVLTILHD